MWNISDTMYTIDVINVYETDDVKQGKGRSNFLYKNKKFGQQD